MCTKTNIWIPHYAFLDFFFFALLHRAADNCASPHYLLSFPDLVPAEVTKQLSLLQDALKSLLIEEAEQERRFLFCPCALLVSVFCLVVVVVVVFPNSVHRSKCNLVSAKKQEKKKAQNKWRKQLWSAFFWLRSGMKSIWSSQVWGEFIDSWHNKFPEIFLFQNFQVVFVFFPSVVRNNRVLSCPRKGSQASTLFQVQH